MLFVIIISSPSTTLNSSSRERLLLFFLYQAKCAVCATETWQTNMIASVKTICDNFTNSTHTELYFYCLHSQKIKKMFMKTQKQTEAHMQNYWQWKMAFFIISLCRTMNILTYKKKLIHNDQMTVDFNRIQFINNRNICNDVQPKRFSYIRAVTRWHFDCIDKSTFILTFGV